MPSQSNIDTSMNSATYCLHGDTRETVYALSYDETDCGQEK